VVALDVVFGDSDFDFLFGLGEVFEFGGCHLNLFRNVVNNRAIEQ
jgi:hypothetical protein